MKSNDPTLNIVKLNDEFLQLIEQERARVNRNGSNFTLVLLQVIEGFGKSKEVQSDVLNSILERIRTIDQIGFYDDDHIGLLLPQTGRDGATKIIDDLWRNKTFTTNVSSYRLYCYP